ncbi:MAG TPA: hypothetical protein VFD52_08810 [Clostridia bacterium]|nr:hypothetical protein [Clostridia bacterium]
MNNCEIFKKVAQIVGIVVAVAAVVTAVYFAVTKFLEIKGRDDNDEDYVSCSFYDEEPILVEEVPEEETEQ